MKKKYIDIPEKKTVIALMDKKYTVTEELESFNKKIAFILNKLDFMFKQNESSNPYFKSKAVAHESDEFDVKVGREIASQKVDYKYHNSMIKQYNRYIDTLENIITTLELLRNKHISKSRKIKSKMKKFS